LVYFIININILADTLIEIHAHSYMLGFMVMLKGIKTMLQLCEATRRDVALHRYFTLSVARAHKFLKLKAAKKT